jgi:hypothetical protein
LVETFRRFHQPKPPNPASAVPNNGKAAGSGTAETLVQLVPFDPTVQNSVLTVPLIPGVPLRKMLLAER